MKKRGTHAAAFIAVLSLILSVLYTPLAIAPSHPVFIGTDGEINDEIWNGKDPFDVTIGDTEIIYDAGSIGPGNFLYGFDQFLNQFQSPDATAKETIAEIKNALAAGDAAAAAGDEDGARKYFSAAGRAAEQLSSSLGELRTEMGQIDDIEGVLDWQGKVLAHSEAIEEMKQILVQEVVAGNLNEDFAELSGIDSVLEEVTSLQETVNDKRQEEISETAQETGQTELEVELNDVEPLEEQRGISGVYSEEISADHALSESALEQIKTELKQAEESGADIPNKEILYQTINEADIKLSESRTLIENGLEGRAFDELIGAQNLVLETDRLLESVQETGTLGEQEQGDLQELREVVEFSQDERVEEAEQYVDEYEEAKEVLAEEHPEEAEKFGELGEKYKKVMELAEKLSGEYQSEYERMIAEGQTPEGATITLSERFAAVYQHAYGDPFIPPGIDLSQAQVEQAGISRAIGAAGIAPTTGVVQGYTYKDPATGYKYEMTSTGWKYTDPLTGTTFEEEFPEGYTPKSVFKEGFEKQIYTYNSPEGAYKFEYSSTGYKVTKPDGTVEVQAYPPGAYATPDGGKVNINERGFDYYNGEQGKWENWNYDPQYNTYVAPGGRYYDAGGAGIHENVVSYDSGTKKFEYSYGGESWNYDPATSTWMNDATKETFTQSVKAVAPVGHEDGKEYRDPYTGDTWNYDSSSGAWSSSSGKSFTPSTQTYSGDGGVGYSYTYDPATGVTSYTNVDSSGKTWTSTTTYDPVSGTTTTSSTDPNTGQTTSWTSTTAQNSDGTWTSSTTWTDPATGQVQTSSYSYSGTSYGSGSYSGYTGGDYSGSGSGMESGTMGGYTSPDSGGTGGTGGGGGTGDGGGGGTPTGGAITSVIGYAIRDLDEPGESFFSGYTVGIYRRFRGGVSISTSLGGNIVPSGEVIRAIPDLVIEKIEANFYRNNELDVNLADVTVIVKNIGTESAGSNEIRIDDMFGSKLFAVPALSPGKTYSLALTYHYLTSYTHRAVVDVNNAVHEANEKNNEGSQII